MISLQEFAINNINKQLDFDGQLGYQCMDLVEFYNKEVIGAPRLGGNAKDLINNPLSDYYTYQTNTPLYIPPAGAIAIWNSMLGKGYGHTAIIMKANLLSFVSLDQNWPEGAPVKQIGHNYTNVVGFLVPRPKDNVVLFNDFRNDIQSILNKYPSR